jgi:hypothetical protein
MGYLMKLFSRLIGQTPPAPPVPPAAAVPAVALQSASVESLISVILGSGEPALKRAAQLQLAQFVDAGGVDAAGLLGQVDHSAERLAVLALCKDAQLLPQALDQISDPAEIAQLVVAASSSRVRQLAAEKVQDAEQLRALLNRVRGKDNTVYRILKQKRDAQNAESRRVAQLLTDVGVVCSALERHSRRGFDPLYTATFEQLAMQWRALPEQPDANIEARGAAAIEICRQLIAEQQRQQAAQNAERAARQAEAEARAQARQAEQAVAAAQAEATAQLQREAAAVHEAQERLRAEQLAVREQVYRQVGGLIRKAGGALGDGNTREAAGLRRAIDEKLSPELSLPPHLARTLQQLDERLTAVKEWKDYAVAPKRVELIDEMEALIGSTMEPQALARQIQSLQQEWRTIGKGIAGDTSAEWERFHRAAEAAYLPCKAFFEEQAQARATKLELRKAVLARLIDFEAAQDAQQLDWRLVSTVLREAPLEWRSHYPVERAANKPVEAEFSAAMMRLQARLTDFHARNAALKQSLIERARQLLTLEDGAAAIDAAKRLQVDWKNAGPVPREQDQQLWAEFRVQCDAIFERRQQAHAEYVAGLDANKDRALALCVEVELLAAQDGAALREGVAKLPELRTAFEALDELPRADARAIYQRFERAVELCRTQVAQLRARAAEQSVADLFEAGRHAQAYEWAVAGNADLTERDELQQAAEQFIAGVKTWPKASQPIISRRLAAAGTTTLAASAAREQQLRTLCIRGEILSGAPTPGEDEALRRAYQLQKLVSGMGKGIAADDWDTLVMEWLGVAAVAPELHAQLETRFRQGLARRGR